MLSLLKNKIRNKFLQTDYIHPYIIWCIDVFLSVICSFSIFLSFHYMISISIHFNQQRYILLIAVISSIVWTGICKTYEGIIRYSTLVELTRIIYAMLLKALTFVLFAYITLDYIGLFIYSIIITSIWKWKIICMMMWRNNRITSWGWYNKNLSRTTIWTQSVRAWLRQILHAKII